MDRSSGQSALRHLSVYRWRVWPAMLVCAIVMPVCANADIAQRMDRDGIVTLSNTAAGRPFAPAKTRAERDELVVASSRYDNYIRQAAVLYQIPENLVRAVIMVESGFNPRAISKADARGLMQLVPSTASRMLVDDVLDPRQNIYGGVRYLRVLANLFNGDLFLTLAAYNAGEGAVVKFGGIPPYPETQAYVARVVAYYRQYQGQM